MHVTIVKCIQVFISVENHKGNKVIYDDGDHDERVEQKRKATCFNTWIEAINRGWNYFLFLIFKSFLFAYFQKC